MGWADQLEDFPASYFNSTLLHSFWLCGVGLGFLSLTKQKSFFSFVKPDRLVSAVLLMDKPPSGSPVEGSEASGKAAAPCRCSASPWTPRRASPPALRAGSCSPARSEGFEQTLVRLPRANAAGDSAVCTGIREVSALCSLRSGLFGTGCISLGLRLILISLSGECDLSFIP